MSSAAAAIDVMCGANRRTPAFISGRKAPKVETRHNGRAGIEAREGGAGALAGNEAHRAHRGAGQQPGDIGADVGEGEDQLGRAGAQPRRLARPQLVEGHGLDRFARPQPRLDGPRIVAGGRRGTGRPRVQAERAAAASGRGEQAGVEQALQLQRRHTQAASLGDQAIDTVAHRPSAGSAGSPGLIAATQVPAPARPSSRPDALSSL